MDLQKKCLILGLILFAFCELSATTGLCRFARMFPNQGKPRDSKDDTSKEDKVVTCNRDDLPKALHGSFDCPGSTDVLIGDVCNLMCDEGFYPVSTNQTVCEPDVTRDPNGKWSEGNFSCQAVTCDMNDLSEVLDGSFDCPGSTDLFIGDVCNLTCFYGFHPTSTYHTVCEPGVKGNQNGKWFKGNFTCQDCSDVLDGRIYRFVLDEMSVSNATKNCKSLNSSLVFIERKEEDNFVHQLVSKCAPNKGQWKGFTWIQNKESDSGYDNWDTNEPNAGRNTQHCPKEECVGMKYDSGKWHDTCCNRPFYSVCEQSE